MLKFFIVSAALFALTINIAFSHMGEEMPWMVQTLGVITMTFFLLLIAALCWKGFAWLFGGESSQETKGEREAMRRHVNL